MRGAIIIALVVLFLGSAACPQERKPLEFSLGAGLSWPLHPDQFSAGWKAGPGGMFGVGYDVSSNIHVTTKAEYHVFPHDPPLSDVPDTDKAGSPPRALQSSAAGGD